MTTTDQKLRTPFNMGGNAIKKLGISSIRADKALFEDITSSVLSVLLEFYPSENLHVIRAYRNKDSFGDLDVVICGDTNASVDIIKNRFNSKEIIRNSNVLSFPLGAFQIDFTHHSDKEIFAAACDYYDWSPAGNCVGKIAHQFGLSYGHDGLSYLIREEFFDGKKESTNTLDRVILSNNTEKIHNFLGFSHKKWLDGFDNESDIFDWVINSEFFNRERFSFDEMNHRARVRDKKRPDYNRMMKYIEDLANVSLEYKRLENKYDYFNWIKKSFPILEEKIEAARQKLERKKEIRAKFNGHIVSEITGLQNQELGVFMATFKKSIDDWENFVYTSNLDQVVEKIKEVKNAI